MRILSIILSASSFSAAFVRSSSRGDVPLLSSSTALSHSSSSRTPGELDDMNDIVKARTAISEAIAVGAPAYNRGDIRKCAEVYLETARGMSNLELPKSLRDRLKSEVDGGITDATNYNDKAWALREVFDAIMEYQPPIVPRDSSQEAEVNMEPFTPAQLGEARNVMDSVMGGVSQGGFISEANTFFGETSLRNNGGFASIRWRFPNAQNWSYAKGIYIRSVRVCTP